MATSKHTLRLRELQNDIVSSTNSYRRSSGPHKATLHALRGYPVESAASAKALDRLIRQGQDDATSYRADYEAAATAIEARATKGSAQPSEATLRDVQRMFDKGATLAGVCQWALDAGKPDAFPAIRDELRMQAFAAQSANPGSAEPMHVLKDNQAIVTQYEKQIMSDDQKEALRELDELENSRRWLETNLDNMQRYFDSQASGGPAYKFDVVLPWIGLPGLDLPLGNITLDPEPLPTWEHQMNVQLNLR